MKFFGVHGTNEKGPEEDVAGDQYAGGVGPEIWKIWLRFSNSNEKPLSKSFEAVNFPESHVDFPQAYAWSQATFLYQVSRLEAGANNAAIQLVTQLSDTYAECGNQTRYLVVGYSQGAWAVDLALRRGLPSAVESQIAGILLLGDPAYPPNSPHKDRKGIAVSHGQARGVDPPYAPLRFSGRFVSICVSYDGGVYDPICWFDGNLTHLSKDLWAHTSYASYPDTFVRNLNGFI
jgi:hypothetical protein